MKSKLNMVERMFKKKVNVDDVVEYIKELQDEIIRLEIRIEKLEQF